MLTRQDAFNAALFGIRGQGYRRSVRSETWVCRYRGENGDKCAIGHCIPDNLYSESMEKLRFDSLMRSFPAIGKLLPKDSHSFLLRLQRIHDNRLEVSWKIFELSMEQLARDESLTYTPIPST